jgi:hypothetical protein
MERKKGGKRKDEQQKMTIKRRRGQEEKRKVAIERKCERQGRLKLVNCQRRKRVNLIV